MDKRTDEKSDGTHALPLTSLAWQQQIDTVTAAISAQEARLTMLTHAKAAALTDPKKLMALEDEELALPATIEQLKRRRPLLEREHEAALKVEAAERLQEIVTLAETAAHQVSESTVRLRDGMRALIEQMAEVRRAAEGHALLVAEQQYLQARFTLPPVRMVVGDLLDGNERGRFLRECEARLRQDVRMTAWDRMRAEWQEQQRRQAEQRREPVGPQRVHYADGANAETDALHQEARRRMSDAARAGEKQVIHWSDGVRSQ